MDWRTRYRDGRRMRVGAYPPPSLDFQQRAPPRRPFFLPFWPPASLQLSFRRCFPCGHVSPQRQYHVLNLRLKFGAVTRLPCEVGRETPSDLGAVAALPLVVEDVAVQVERDERP